LHFLKQLKRSGAGRDDLLYFYITVIRSVLEFFTGVYAVGLISWAANCHRAV